MKSYEDVIDRMNAMVNQYHKMDMDGAALSELLKSFVSALYYMETVRADVHDKWQTKVKELIAEGSSVSRAENEAHVEFPDMYRLRRVMDAGYEIVGAIRTNISLLKHEQKLEQNG
jgi:hypothetical protein